VSKKLHNYRVTL